MMRGDESLGSRYRNTRHSSYCLCNNDAKIYEKEGIEVSSGEEISVNRSIDTSQSSSSNHGCHESNGHISLETIHSASINILCCGRRSSMTSHYVFHNNGGHVDKGASRSQDNINYSS